MVSLKEVPVGHVFSFEENNGRTYGLRVHVIQYPNDVWFAEFTTGKIRTANPDADVTPEIEKTRLFTL